MRQETSEGKKQTGSSSRNENLKKTKRKSKEMKGKKTKVRVGGKAKNELVNEALFAKLINL